MYVNVEPYSQDIKKTHKPTTHAWLTLWVNIFGQLECIRVGQVSVGWRDSKDETVFLTDILHDHVSYLVLYVCWLVAYRHLGDARQVHESQVQHCKRSANRHTDHTYVMRNKLCGYTRGITMW